MSLLLPRGILIAFEGIDGAGKTTQLRRVAAELVRAGLTVRVSKEPTDGPHGARIRRSATEGRLPPREELEAFLADRRAHVADLLAPALARGEVVLVDRYYLSSVAYQGARGLEPDEVLHLNEAFAPRPDLVVLIDVPPKVGLARVRSRDVVENLFEREDELGQARAIFDQLQGEHIRRLDGCRDREPLTLEILTLILEGPLRAVLPSPAGEPEVSDPIYRFPVSTDPRWKEIAQTLLGPSPGLVASIEELVARPDLSDAERLAELRALITAS